MCVYIFVSIIYSWQAGNILLSLPYRKKFWTYYPDPHTLCVKLSSLILCQKRSWRRKSKPYRELGPSPFQAFHLWGCPHRAILQVTLLNFLLRYRLWTGIDNRPLEVLYWFIPRYYRVDRTKILIWQDIGITVKNVNQTVSINTKNLLLRVTRNNILPDNIRHKLPLVLGKNKI